MAEQATWQSPAGHCKGQGAVWSTRLHHVITSTRHMHVWCICWDIIRPVDYCVWYKVLCGWIANILCDLIYYLAHIKACGIFDRNHRGGGGWWEVWKGEVVIFRVSLLYT